MNVIVDSLMVNYDRQGKGPVIVMLHGWGDTLQTFDGLVERLKSEYEMVRVDLPGFGGTQQPSGAWSLEEYARFVGSFAKKIGLDEIFALVGHSNGGAIAIRGLADDDLRVQRLILIASAGIRAREKGRKLAWKMVAKAGKMMTVALPSRMKQKLRRRLYTGLGSDLLVVPQMEETFKKVVGEDVQSEAMLLDVATLIITGTEDTSTPPEYAETFHRAIHDSQLSLVEGAGHFVHQEQTVQVAETIKSFLK